MESVVINSNTSEKKKVVTKKNTGNTIKSIKMWQTFKRIYSIQYNSSIEDIQYTRRWILQ